MEKEILFHSGQIWTSDGIKSWMIIKGNIIFELGEGEFKKKFNGTSIGRRPKTSSMNKNRRRQLGKKPYYRGQGK